MGRAVFRREGAAAKAPLGYRNAVGPNGKKCIEPAPELALAQVGLDYLSLDRSSAIFDEGELDPSRTAAKLATVQTGGAQSVTRETEFYRLEVILAVGYRGDRGGHIRNVSPWRWASSPAHSSHGLPGRRLPWEISSSTACVTYSRNEIPNALAVALALRKVGSGISSVVFTTPVSHIYGAAARRDSSARAGRVRVFYGVCCQTVNSRTKPPTRSNEINGIAEM
jgi:hypothetical protein